MADTIQFAVNAISGGSIYALMTLGLALLFGIMGLMNFAYGELIMAGGFTMYLLRDLPWPVLVLATTGVVIAVALLTERLAFRPLRAGSPLTLLIASFAVSIMLQNVARMSIGERAQGVRPYAFLEQSVDVLGVQATRLDIFTIVVTAALLVGLTLLIKRTSLGMRLRASAEDFEMATLLGVRSNAVIASAFAITGVLAAAVTLLLIARQGSVSATVGSTPLLIAFVGAVIGGMGSLTGAALGGFLLGAVTSLLDAALPPSIAPFRDAFVFSAVILVLVFRPQGLIPSAVGRV